MGQSCHHSVVDGANTDDVYTMDNRNLSRIIHIVLWRFTCILPFLPLSAFLFSTPLPSLVCFHLFWFFSMRFDHRLFLSASMPSCLLSIILIRNLFNSNALSRSYALAFSYLLFPSLKLSGLECFVYKGCMFNEAFIITKQNIYSIVLPGYMIRFLRFTVRES